MDLSFSFMRDPKPVGWCDGLVTLVNKPGAPVPAGESGSADEAADPLSPADGCFNGEMAAALLRWKAK